MRPWWRGLCGCDANCGRGISLGEEGRGARVARHPPTTNDEHRAPSADGVDPSSFRGRRAHSRQSRSLSPHDAEQVLPFDTSLLLIARPSERRASRERAAKVNELIGGARPRLSLSHTQQQQPTITMVWFSCDACGDSIKKVSIGVPRARESNYRTPSLAAAVDDARPPPSPVAHPARPKQPIQQPKQNSPSSTRTTAAAPPSPASTAP